MREASPIDEGAVRRFDVSDPYLAIAVCPYLRVLSRKHFAIEEPVDRGRYSLGVRLAADPQSLGVEGDRYRFSFESSIER